SLRLLGEKVVSEADRELPLLVELLDDGVVVRKVLEAATGVDGAGHAEPIQLAHELARRIELVLERQLRPFGQRRVEDAGVGFGEQESDWSAARVADDLTAWRLRSVLGVTDRPQGGGIQKCAVIEVEQKHRRVGSEGVDLLELRESLLRKLMLGETTNDAYPLRRRCDGDLPLQHVHGVGERSHAVPPQLHVETQAAADDVK